MATWERALSGGMDDGATELRTTKGPGPSGPHMRGDRTEQGLACGLMRVPWSTLIGGDAGG